MQTGRRQILKTLMAMGGLGKTGQAQSAWTVYRTLSKTRLTGLAVLGGEPVMIGLLAARPVLWCGEKGNPMELPDSPESIAAAGNRLWLAGGAGVWTSADRGVSWKSSWKGDGLKQVYFIDERHGYAAGGGKTLIETVDGGLNWKRVPEADDPTTNTATTSYNWIHFVTPRVGIVTGSSRPNRSGQTSEAPFWRDPQKATRRKEWPAASITLETRDGGVHWKASTTSVFGQITRVRYSRDGQGLAVIEFHDLFDWPAEVFSINLRSGKMERVYRERERAVTDALIFTGSRGMLAAVDVQADAAGGETGTVSILQSDDLTAWTAMEVPAIRAGRVWLVEGDKGQLWGATDTGIVIGYLAAR